MASAVASQHIQSSFLFQVWDHDPGGTSATIVSADGGTTKKFVDMKDYTHFAVIAIQTVIGSSSGITKVELIASDDTAGTNVVVVKDSGTVDADALCDWLILECNESEIAQLATAAGINYRYVAGRITQSNAGDEAVVVYFGLPKRKYNDLTPDTTIS